MNDRGSGGEGGARPWMGEAARSEMNDALTDVDLEAFERCPDCARQEGHRVVVPRFHDVQGLEVLQIKHGFRSTEPFDHLHVLGERIRDCQVLECQPRRRRGRRSGGKWERGYVGGAPDAVGDVEKRDGRQGARGGGEYLVE